MTSIYADTLLTKQLIAIHNLLHTSGRGSFTDTNPLANITILGVQQSVSNVTLNGVSVGSGVDYDNTSKVLTITGLENATATGAWTADWVLTWQ